MSTQTPARSTGTGDARARGGALLAVAGASLWGTSGTSQALLQGDHSPVAVGALRAVVATAALLALALTRRDALVRLRRCTTQGRWPWLLLAGAGVGAYQLAFFAAVSRTGVGVGTLVTLGTAPTVAGLLGWLLQGERPSRTWFASTVLALAGAALLVLGAGGERQVDALGLLLALVAGACFASYTVAGRRVAAPGIDPLSLTTAIFLVSSLVLAVPLASQPLGFVTQPRSLLVLLWLGVVATALAYSLYQSSMHHISAASAATLALAEPMVANVLAVAVLHERFTPMMGLGVVLVLAGLALLGRS